MNVTPRTAIAMLATPLALATIEQVRIDFAIL